MRTWAPALTSVAVTALIALSACTAQVAPLPPAPVSQRALSPQPVAAQRQSSAAAQAAQVRPSQSPASAPAAGSAGHDMASMSASAQADASSGPALSPQRVYDPVLAPARAETVHRISLTAQEGEQEIAPGIKYAVWTFNG